MAIVQQGASNRIVGTLALTGADQQLPRVSNCRRVWLGPAQSGTTGAVTNAAPFFVGGFTSGGAKSYAKQVALDNLAGVYEHVVDTVLLWIKGTNGDKVEYIIEV